MAAVDLGVEVLQEPDLVVAAGVGEPVAGELDEVEVVRDGDRARQVGDERDARLQRPDQERLAASEVARDLLAQLAYARVDLVGVEVDLADPFVESRQEAFFRP